MRRTVAFLCALSVIVVRADADGDHDHDDDDDDSFLTESTTQQGDGLCSTTRQLYKLSGCGSNPSASIPTSFCPVALPTMVFAINEVQFDVNAFAQTFQDLHDARLTAEQKLILNNLTEGQGLFRLIGANPSTTTPADLFTSTERRLGADDAATYSSTLCDSVTGALPNGMVTEAIRTAFVVGEYYTTQSNGIPENLYSVTLYTSLAEAHEAAANEFGAIAIFAALVGLTHTTTAVVPSYGSFDNGITSGSSRDVVEAFNPLTTAMSYEESLHSSAAIKLVAIFYDESIGPFTQESARVAAAMTNGPSPYSMASRRGPSGVWKRFMRP